MAVSCALCFWTFAELNRLYFVTLETNATYNIHSLMEIVLESDEVSQRDFNAANIEQNLTGQIMLLATSLDSEKTNEMRVRNDIWQLLELNDYVPFDNAVSWSRLETVYTPETITSLHPLIAEMRENLIARNWENFFHAKILQSYLILLFALLSICLGATIVSFETLRRKTALV